MTGAETGWYWFEEPSPSEAEANGSTMDQGLASAVARCFSSRDGQRVLKHLRAVTLERTLSPAASDAMLRHLEGQRSLVAYLVKLTARGLGNGALNASATATSEPGQETAVVTRSSIDE